MDRPTGSCAGIPGRVLGRQPVTAQGWAEFSRVSGGRLHCTGSTRRFRAPATSLDVVVPAPRPPWAGGRGVWAGPLASACAWPAISRLPLPAWVEGVYQALLSAKTPRSVIQLARGAVATSPASKHTFSLKRC